MTTVLTTDLLDRVRERLAGDRAEPTPARVAAALRAESGGVLGDSDLLTALRHLQTELTLCLKRLNSQPFAHSQTSCDRRL